MDSEKIRLHEEKQQLVVKSNDLILKTRYSLSVIQQKLIIYLISKIVASDTELKEVEISIKDFCELTNIEPKGNNYEQVRENIKSLRDKSYWIKLDEETELLYSWLDYAVIKKNDGNIKIALSQSLKPFLLQLKGNFTKYRLIEILKLKSKHSIRLFETLQAFLYKGELIIELDEFKNLLDIKDKYNDYRDLKKGVIEPSLKEINAHTFLYVEYEPIKKNRKVVKLKFKINEAMGYQLSFLDE